MKPFYVWVLGSTLEDAQAFIDAHPSLAGARPTSPLSKNLWGALAHDYFTTPDFETLERLEHGYGPEARKARKVMERNRAKMKAVESVGSGSGRIVLEAVA